MKWSWRIGRLAGIDVYIHATFLLLLIWVALESYFAHGSIAEAARGLIFILALFGIVVLHELGHALTARRYGIRTRDIILLPIGGIARLERMPEDPRQELVVAFAGPAVNVVLAAAIYIALRLGQGLATFNSSTEVGAGLLSQLFWVNVSLAVFNLLPAFPMDGGRVLRALLAMRMDYVRATRVAATVGQAMALVFGFVGLFSNPFLVFIALFVWLGAAQEASLVQMRAALGDIPVARAMVTDFRTLSPIDSLAKAVSYAAAGFQQDFPVVDDRERLVGMLTRGDVAAALRQFGADARVGEVMERRLEAVEPQDMLSTAFARFEDCNCHILPVVQDGRVVGILTAQKVADLLTMQQHRWPPAHRPRAAAA